MIKRVGNFIKSFKNHLQKGSKKTDFEVMKERRKICKLCEYNKLDVFKRETCVICGCDIILKTQWKEQTCPINKW